MGKSFYNSHMTVDWKGTGFHFKMESKKKKKKNIKENPFP